MRLRRFKLRSQYGFRALERFRDSLGIERQYDSDYDNNKYEKKKLIKNPNLEEVEVPVKTKKEFSKPIKFFKKVSEINIKEKIENLKNKFNKEA